MWSTVFSPAVHFFTLSNKRHDIREKVFEDKMCVLIFSATFVERFLIPRRIQRYVVINANQ